MTGLDDRPCRVIQSSRQSGEDEYLSFHEAIAAALADLGPDDVVLVHDEECKMRTAEDECTCEPLTLRGGHEA